MDVKKLKDIIEKYDSIVLQRHKKPDMDAIGSQLGLKYALLENYPDKKIYVVGDQNKFDYDNEMQQIPDEVFKESLVIITDVAVSALVSDERFNLAKEIVIIDHHKNPSDIERAHLYIDSTYEAAGALVFDLLEQMGLKINEKSANYFLQAIITDSGRFQYLQNAPRLFLIASKLCKYGANPVPFYNWLYVEKKEDRDLKNKIAARIKYHNNISYLVNDNEFFKEFNYPDFFTISRGMIGVMAGVEECPIWVNFTYDESNDNRIVMEARSRKYPVVNVCKKYGGGGHELACGATLEKDVTIEQVLNDFESLLK